MSKSKKSAKKTAATPIAKAKEARVAGSKPIIRAIRVNQEILDAAKEYKKATGKSFYTLGFETVFDRLKSEGYMKATEAGAGA